MVKKAAMKEAEMRNSSMQSKYKGVRKRKWGKWVSEIRLPNSRERIWLGSFDTPEKAARAFDAAQFCLRGCKSDFNFPDNPPSISGGRSLTPPEIREAAARFANAQDDSISTREEEESVMSKTQPESPESVLSETRPESPESVLSETRPEAPESVLSETRPESPESVLSETRSESPESGLSETRPESPSTSASEVATTLEYDLSSLDTLPSDFGMFPGFDDFSDGFSSFSGDQFTEILPVEDYGEVIFDESLFLWDF